VELTAPLIVSIEELPGQILEGATVVGEVPDSSANILASRGHRVITGLGGQRRPLAVALAGLDALARGVDSSPESLLPLYLRPAVRASN
jgi:hypothetical protein